MYPDAGRRSFQPGFPVPFVSSGDYATRSKPLTPPSIAYFSTGKAVIPLCLRDAFVYGPTESKDDLGIVQDSFESVVAGATVVVTNQATGREYTLTTDSSGIFVAPEIPVGTYKVTASLQGFKTRVQEGIVLRVSDRTRLVMTLETGEVREVVTVTGDAPLIETASNTLGGTIERSQVENLPLNGRDPNVLLAQVPGVRPAGQHVPAEHEWPEYGWTVGELGDVLDGWRGCQPC
jgi:hypothetical protein